MKRAGNKTEKRMQRFFSALNLFNIASFLLALMMGLPLLNILLGIFEAPSAAWIHIRENLLWTTIINTLSLLSWVAILAAVMGTFAAIVVTRYEFKGRQLLSWLLVIPLAIPAYILGYVYADMVSFTGTVTRFFRMVGFDLSLNVMSLRGAAFIFSLTLYPYVYMIVRSALNKQSASFSESARTLGLSPLNVFWRITVPLLRPAMVAGTFLVLLETLNDYGLVSYFNIRVFSFAIFDAWFRLGDLNAAIRLAAILLLLVLSLVVIERLLRGNRRYTMDIRSRPIKRLRLRGYQKTFPFLLWSLLTFAMFIPLFQLFYYAFLTWQRTINLRLLLVIINSISLAFVVTVLIVTFALLLTNANRGKKSLQKNAMIRFTTLGYAIPGAVIAVAVLVSFVWLDEQFRPLYDVLFSQSRRLILTGSILMLGFAMVLRFMAIGYSNLEAQYDKIGERFTAASYTLNHGKLKTLIKVDIPLLKGGLLAALIIVFIDVLKELPLTLILRPTNYDTLASLVYTYAREEMIQETAIPSLVMIGLASIAVYILTHVNVKKGDLDVRKN
jgi:iron(III) transport system permease protein